MCTWNTRTGYDPKYIFTHSCAVLSSSSFSSSSFSSSSPPHSSTSSAPMRVWQNCDRFSLSISFDDIHPSKIPTFVYTTHYITVSFTPFPYFSQQQLVFGPCYPDRQQEKKTFSLAWCHILSKIHHSHGALYKVNKLLFLSTMYSSVSIVHWVSVIAIFAFGRLECQTILKTIRNKWAYTYTRSKCAFYPHAQIVRHVQEESHESIDGDGDAIFC